MKKFLSFILSLTLLLNAATAVSAAEPETVTEKTAGETAANDKTADDGAADVKPIAWQRQEDLDFFWETLTETHPDPFAKTPESEFATKMEALAGTAAAMDDFTFALYLQSIAALAGDSHTSVNIGSPSVHFYPFTIEYFGGVPVLYEAPKEYESLLGKEVAALNGIPLAEILERFGNFLSNDNEIKLRRSFKQTVNVAEILGYLGIGEPEADVTLTVMDTEPTEISLSPMSMEELNTLAFTGLSDLRESTPATAHNRDSDYFSMPLNDSVYYIQYNTCVEDPELPMEDFCAQIQADIGAGGYAITVIDLRNNGGGSDGLILPVLAFLNSERLNNGMKIFSVVGEATFSSAGINAMMLKDMGAITVGSPISGSVDHFGSVPSFELPNSGIRFGVSSKFIDMEDVLESGIGYGVEALRPDYDTSQTIEDYLRGADTSVEYILANGMTLTLPDDGNKDLTRGRFITLLREKALAFGKGEETGTAPFQDIFPIAGSLPAIGWAYGAGLINGVSAELFAPARRVTVEEAVILFERFSAYLGTPWQEVALPDDFTPEGTMTVKQGRELIDGLFPAGLL